MELMPHIKALLDDLIKMTKHIDVKRGDLADKYEDNTRTVLLYQQASEILYGTPSFFTYTVYPREVLNSYGKWIKTEDISEFGIMKPLTSSKNITCNMLSGKKMTISNEAPLTNEGSIGEGWVKVVDNGSFYKTKQYEASMKDVNYRIYRSDSEGNYNPSDKLPTFIFNGTLKNSQNLNVYIKDEKYNKYIKINISFTSEYIEIPEDIKNIEDPDEYDLKLSDYLNSSNNVEFTYNMNNGKYVEYVKNSKNNNEMIIRDDSLIENPEQIYLLRYKTSYYFSDSNYYNNTEDYFSTRDNVDETKYIKVDDNIYYLSDDIYSLLYTKNENGNYIYDNDSKTFIEILDDDELLKIKPSELYIKEKELSPDENTYYRYSKIDDGLISQEFYKIDGQIFNRYETINGKLATYYAYDNNEILDDNRCVIDVETVTSKIQFRTRITFTGVEIPMDIDDQQLYYFYKDQEGSYTKEYFDEEKTIYRYINSTSTTDEKYMMSNQVPDVEHDTCIYINDSLNNEYYIYRKEFTDNQVSLYYNDRNKIPNTNYIDHRGVERSIRDDLKNKMAEYIMSLYCPDYNNEDYSVPIYTGETNRYYRELNGLPPLNVSLYHPKIDRYKINPYYEGTNINPYLFELTDAEVEKMEELGYLKQYQDMYPSYTYLRHLGKHRIDVITARNAAPYDILHLDDAEMNLTAEMFTKNYSIAKNYILKRYYKPNMFGVHEYYHSYIGFNICLLALMMCIVKSGEILVENKFIDQETVDLVLKSYGFEHTFDSIPLVYRREIARNIVKLIRNKGIDKIYETIYDLFNIDDIEVYKYYFTKTFVRDENNVLLYYLIDKNGKIKYNKDNERIEISKFEYDSNKDEYEGCTLKPVYDIGVSQVPISSNNIVKDIMNDSNSLNYNDITNSDKYWGVYESEENVKNKIIDIPFNYMNSKYITLNNKFNLTELNFNSAYLLNYLLETTSFNNNPIYIDIEEINEPQTIANLLIMLFAIQSVRYGFDGNIPSDIISAATVYKFNLDETVAAETEDGKVKRIIEYYLNYMTQDGAIKALDVQDLIINTVKKENNKTNSLKAAIYNNQEDKTVNAVAETYLKNITTDDTLSKTNEASLYNRLIEYRENAKTITDFRCFDELLHCISVCEETQKVYKLPNSIWEKMYECQYQYSGSNSEYNMVSNSDKMYYTDILYSWDLLNYEDKKNILSLVDGNAETRLIRLSNDTYISNNGYRIVSKTVKDEYDKDTTIHIIEEFIEGEWIETDLVPYDLNVYYEHFVDAKDFNILITNRNPISYGFDNDYKYIVNINSITREELLNTKNILDFIDRIDIYKKEYLFNKTNLDLDKYIRDLIYADTPGGSQIIRDVSYTNIGINNTAYIGHIPLNEFISTTNYTLSGPVMYVEVLKNTNTSENIYDVKIYKKCDYALTYSMYLREMAPELYTYLQIKTGETDKEYRERIDKFSSTIIATIENDIDSKKVKEQLNLSYVDFSNISKYIRLIINVFKSYSIDLSSMDIIYNIDNKNNNRVKIIDTFSTDEKYSIDSNLRITSDLSYNEKNFIKDVFSIKDELYVEFYARQFYDSDPMDSESYYRVSNSAIPETDYTISLYYYTKSLENTYNLRKEIDNMIGN